MLSEPQPLLNHAGASMHPWFTKFSKEIDKEGLSIDRAIDFLKFVEEYGEGVARIIGVCRLQHGEEAILLEVKTGCPQRPAYPIKKKEKVAILFWSNDFCPSVMSVREDFPDTPHQNSVPEGFPYCLCIDDRSWSEAVLTYTPAELLQRIILWFKKTAQDELHGINQPLDPYFFADQINFTLPKDVFSLGPDEDFDLFAFIRSGSDHTNVSTIPIKNTWPDKDTRGACAFITVEIKPEHMKRIRVTPSNLAELHRELDMRGFNLLGKIKSKITEWISKDKWISDKFHSSLGILLKMPIIHPRTSESKSMSMVAFVTGETVGEIGVKLKILFHNHLDEKGKIPYTHNVSCCPWELQDFNDVSLCAGNVHAVFDSELATRMAGHAEIDSRKVVLVGAGAIGSLVAEFLSREGRFEWTIVDDDTLLPHNLARHALTSEFLDIFKAKGLAAKLKLNCQGMEANGLVANVLNLKESKDAFQLATQSANIILDASASVAVSRKLCDLPVEARRISFFFNPVGNAVILMAENNNRTIDLKTIEASFYRELLSNDDISNLLTIPSSKIPYSGDCRALTTQLPASRAQILSGLVAMEINSVLKSDAALLKIWKIESNGAVSVIERYPKEPYVIDGKWRIRMLGAVKKQLESMRKRKLPYETGGALMGIVDIPEQEIEILQALPAPPDSKESENDFLRGVEGLTELVTASMGQTLDQIRYIGEWHSHPVGCSTQPSVIDLGQLAQLSETLSMDGCPGVQVIVGDSDINIQLLAKPTS